MRFNKTTIIITSLLSIAFGIFFLRKIHKLKRKQQAIRKLHFKKQVIPPSAIPEIVLKHSELYILGNDTVKDCLIKSEKCALFQSKNKAICSNLRCKFSTNKQQVATLTAHSAYIDHAQKKIFLPGTILGTFQEWQFTNQDVFYNSHTHTMTAVNITMHNDQKFFLRANNSTMDLKQEQLRFENGVECHLRT